MSPRHGGRAIQVAAVLLACACLLSSGNPVASQSQTEAFPGTIVLGRPTGTSVTLNALAEDPATADLEAYVEYGPRGGPFDMQTEPAALSGREPMEVQLVGLAPNRGYRYRLRYRRAGEPEFATGETFAFHTQRPPGEAFDFVIQADSHLDEQSDPELYRQALSNMAADAPDFLIDLGDTFFSEKFATDEAGVIDRHLLQRPFLGLVARSAPLFLVLGNHEGESGTYLDGSDQNLAIWATRARQKYYPNPYPDAFYRGNETFGPFIGQREDYYAWEWGDALFVVLDPFWNTAVKPRRAGSNWAWTLGETQYRWLVDTLEGSSARFKLVFSHNMIGGISFEGRGGIEAAANYEWGGHDPDGGWGFDRERPGWGRPIHQVFVDTGVSAWFHGHDHLYAKQELDGIVYQEVPQPSHPRGGTGQAAEPEYQYLSGVILGSSGHLRLRVEPERVTVEYLRAARADDPRNAARNRQVEHRYEILPRGSQAGPSASPAVPTATPSDAPTAEPTEPPPRTVEPSPTGARPEPAARPLPDTGQTQGFSPIFGEDADYAINPPALMDGGDGTTYDSVSGLTWQRTEGGEMTWEDAATYCDALALGGRTDWRLPDSHELFGILNHGQRKPALDAAYFETAAETEYWWSSTLAARGQGSVWVANVGGGIGPHPKHETRSAGGDKVFAVRCLSGAAGPSSPLPSLDPERGWVTDARTSLVWQRAESAPMAWEEALSYCESSSEAGVGDWRLPNIKELRSLADDGRTRPALDPGAFPEGAGSSWSSSSLVNRPERAWVVEFDSGLASYADKADRLPARCVRGASDVVPQATARPTAVLTITPPAPPGRLYLPVLPSSSRIDGRSDRLASRSRQPDRSPSTEAR